MVEPLLAGAAGHRWPGAARGVIARAAAAGQWRRGHGLAAGPLDADSVCWAAGPFPARLVCGRTGGPSAAAGAARQAGAGGCDGGGPGRCLPHPDGQPRCLDAGCGGVGQRGRCLAAGAVAAPGRTVGERAARGAGDGVAAGRCASPVTPAGAVSGRGGHGRHGRPGLAGLAPGGRAGITLARVRRAGAGLCAVELAAAGGGPPPGGPAARAGGGMALHLS